MKLSLTNITIVTACVIFILGLFIPCFIDKPEKMHKISSRERSIRISGLPPIGKRLLGYSISIGFICIITTFFYSRKIEKTPIDEDDPLRVLFRLRRWWKVFLYLILITAVLTIAEITLAFIGLFTIEHIQPADIFHSRLFDGLTCLLICLWFFLSNRRHIRGIQTIPNSAFIELSQTD